LPAWPNAINIIDGFNGLASMCVAIMLAGIAYVAFRSATRQ
jgi:UDP-N-acetylmuramyl pentapeptide phosphotransferase/UDP-N-acetylglucosamine-1-phosphate transferase